MVLHTSEHKACALYLCGSSCGGCVATGYTGLGV